ncbi:transporter [Sediminicola luteus]|uniref:Transporter n=2 Tax=Sediminicola luteus TaxID=319238 RepID=A0A2A4G8R2_9FLAO|nr:transporter [Sediminicola luteus]
MKNKLKRKGFGLVLVMLLWGCFLKAQSLGSLVEEALHSNPEIQKFEWQYARASERVNEVNTLPNTEFGMGYFASEPETRTGPQRFKVSAKQMLPWFGSITARENYASALADAKYEDIVVAKRKLIASVSQSYYKLFAIRSKQIVLGQNIKLLKDYEVLALNSLEVGKASAVDVLRLQMRQNELERLKKVLEQNFVAERTVLNKLLNRQVDVEVTVADSLPIPEDNMEFALEDLALHPELLKYDKLYHSVEQSELLNQKESSPMFGFGLDYIAVSERPEMDFSDNGKDVVMPMVSLSIPIFNKKYRSKTKQNQLLQKELLSEKQLRLNKLEALFQKAVTDRSAARISYNTQSLNLKQAKNAENILIKGYETGTIDFNDVLDVQELQLKFQIDRIEAVKSYYVQTSIINYLSK